MSGLSQLFNTAWTGLNAASQALETVSNNTANVNTAGYNVESVQQTELPGLPGEPGAGTDVTSIQRSFNQFVFSQLVGAGSANQAAQVAQDNTQNLTAMAVIGMIVQPATARLYGRLPGELLERADEIVAMCWRALS